MSKISEMMNQSLESTRVIVANMSEAYFRRVGGEIKLQAYTEAEASQAVVNHRRNQDPMFWANGVAEFICDEEVPEV